MLAMTQFAMPTRATAAPGYYTWDTRADFEQNVASVDATTTRPNVSTAMKPGSITLPGLITAVSAGYLHTVGLKSDGTVVAVGDNVNGQLNTSGWADITAVSAGGYHTVGLKSDGTVVAVGSSGNGQLDVSGWADIIAISAGSIHTVGLKSDGTVVAVGNNGSGQINTSGWTDITAISAGDLHTVGLKSDGTVVAVGGNDNGQLVVSGWNDITAISAAGYHTVGLKSDGTVVAVGDNGSGQLNVEGWHVTTAVSTSGYHTVGLKSDGTVVAAGWNSYGQLNVEGWTDITAVSARREHTVGLKSDGTVVAAGWNGYGQINTSGWTDITAISAGEFHTVGLKSDGTVVAVGWNNYGQLDTSSWTDITAISAAGYHTVGLKSDGTVVAVGNSGFSQLNVSDWTDITAISAASYHTVGLKSDGTVVAVGTYGFSQLNVSDWTDITAVSTGTYHTVGLKSDGSVVAVGINNDGQRDVSGWTDITAVSAGTYCTVGLKSDGTVVAVGRNEYGQLNVSGWAGLPMSDRIGMLGGTGTAVGLRAVMDTPTNRMSLSAQYAPLTFGEAVKIAVRVSDDGVAWSEPLGSDGQPVDWTTGSGTYFGRAVGDAAWRGNMSALPVANHVDLVVRLESAGVSSPEVRSVSIGLAEYDIAPTAGPGGTISPAATQTVTAGSDSSTFTITPDVGYHFVSASDKNGPITTVAGTTTGTRQYKFRGVLADNTINAVFAIDTYTITPTAGANGTISPSGAQMVAHGSSKTFAITPASGYHIKSVIRDGVSIGTVSSVTFTNVTASHTLSATFERNARPVTRAYGSDRYGTAADLARKGWDPTGKLAWSGVKHIIIANGEPGKESDPLSAAGLAGTYDAPILTVQVKKLPGATKTVITEIAKKNPGVKIHIVGGTSVVPDARWNEIKKIPGVSQVKDRFAGRERFETSALMAARVAAVSAANGRAVTGVILIAGDNPAAYYDALAASPIAYAQTMPMLAVKRGSIPSSVNTVLKSAALKGKPRYAASSATYIGSVPAAGATRLTTSANRYTAATQIANFAAIDRDWTRRADTALASKLPDALTGGAFLGRVGGIMLFTDSSSSIQSTSKAFITGNKDSIMNGWVIGGTSVVPTAQGTSFRNLLK